MADEKLTAARHSLAHLLAAAVLNLWPEAKPTIGPAIENGFYYDFDDLKIGEEDLPKIEEEMRRILPRWRAFSGREVNAGQAREFFKTNLYKLEIIDELERAGEKITFYESGGFVDLCRGGHVTNPSQDIASDAFRLDRVAGAYWRGDEKNKMLTRVYGLAFASSKELADFLSARAAAAERDHRKLGRELDLFLFSELVGPGLPLFTPKGTLVRDLLDSFVWELRQREGYERVDIPHLTKKDLYEKSGHWSKFSNELFHVKTREGHEFVLKPMNCPHHVEIFRRRQWSYREIPQRYATTTKVYRDEQSGELGGLSRVRSITQDDAHVFCRFSQVGEEIEKIWRIIDKFYGSFGLPIKAVRLSLYDPKTPEKFLGTPAVWERAEAGLRQAAKDKNVQLDEAPGEAAFYGPKLDFLVNDSLGREWQVATIQLDLNLPERFDLFCVNERGEKERLVMIHAAIMGSLERFLAPLLEHSGGALPLWLSPIQVVVLPIGEKQHSYAQKIFEGLGAARLRAEIDLSNETLGKKIRRHKNQKIPYLVVVGEKEEQAQILTVESRDHGKWENLTPNVFINRLDEEIKNKK